MLQDPTPERVILEELSAGNLRSFWKWLKSIVTNVNSALDQYSSHFEPDGTLVFTGDATVWNDINIPGTIFRTVGAAALGLFNLPGTGLNVVTFSGTGLASAGQSSFEILHGYKHGSDIVPHVHWCATTTGAGNVKWNLEYAWINRSGVITASNTVSIVVPASGVVGKEQHDAFPTINGAGKEIGGRFQFRLYRDPSDVQDTYAADAGLLDFGFHYELDTVGSRGVTAK